MDANFERGQSVIEFLIVVSFLAALLLFGVQPIIQSYRTAIATVSLTREKR